MGFAWPLTCIQRVGDANNLQTFDFIVASQVNMEFKTVQRSTCVQTEVSNNTINIFFLSLLKLFVCVQGVLAAASPFFATILPDVELENDVCITTELTVKITKTKEIQLYKL